LRTDLSFGVYIYACPIQQLLAIGGLIWLNPFAFFVVSIVATLPLAALSWLLVEKPAQSLKSRLKRKESALVVADVGNRDDIGGNLVADRPTTGFRIHPPQVGSRSK
jgi:peptidoglycan/LPS O-acetylase OafA/YrhL